MKKLAALLLPALLIGCDNLLDDFNRVHNMDYIPEMVEYFQTPNETLERNGGDCEDKAILLQDLLEQRGIDTRLVFGKATPTSIDFHAWLQYEKDGNIIILDPAAGFCGRKRVLSPLHYLELTDHMNIQNHLKDMEARRNVEMGR